MVGMGPKHQRDGTWVYPPIGAAIEIVRLNEIGVCIESQQNMVPQYIATSPIMDLCLATERNPGLRLSRRWWEHPALDIIEIVVVHGAVEVSRGDGY